MSAFQVSVVRMPDFAFDPDCAGKAVELVHFDVEQVHIRGAVLPDIVQRTDASAAEENQARAALRSRFPGVQDALWNELYRRRPGGFILPVEPERLDELAVTLGLEPPSRYIPPTVCIEEGRQLGVSTRCLLTVVFLACVKGQEVDYICSPRLVRHYDYMLERMVKHWQDENWASLVLFNGKQYVRARRRRHTQEYVIRDPEGETKAAELERIYALLEQRVQDEMAIDWRPTSLLPEDCSAF